MLVSRKNAMQSEDLLSPPRFITSTGERAQAIPVQAVPRFRQLLPVSLMLFALWTVLSGKFDAFHLTLGAASAVSIALGTHRLLLLSPYIVSAERHPFFRFPWLRFLAYLPWLLWQIVLSSLHVAYVVLHPRMPMQPQLIRVRAHLPHALARLTLATSITLTPGTVTLDTHDDELLVHALTATAAEDLQPPEGDSDMQRRVAALYTPPPRHATQD
jgi:multicomponent Na+:H+ antiporter subunit E